MAPAMRLAHVLVCAAVLRPGAGQADHAGKGVYTVAENIAGLTLGKPYTKVLKYVCGHCMDIKKHRAACPCCSESPDPEAVARTGLNQGELTKAWEEYHKRHPDSDLQTKDAFIQEFEAEYLVTVRTKLASGVLLAQFAIFFKIAADLENSGKSMQTISKDTSLWMREYLANPAELESSKWRLKELTDEQLGFAGEKLGSIATRIADEFQTNSNARIYAAANGLMGLAQVVNSVYSFVQLMTLAKNLEFKAVDAWNALNGVLGGWIAKASWEQCSKASENMAKLKEQHEALVEAGQRVNKQVAKLAPSGIIPETWRALKRKVPFSSLVGTLF